MKRVLIVSYFFPPISNMGSHRIQRFVRHLREFDWEPIVLTGKLTTGPLCDQRLLEKVPQDLKTERIDSVDLTELWAKVVRRGEGTPAAPSGKAAPVKTQNLTTFLNRWLMIPDKCFPWIRPAVRAGERLVRENNIQAIYSTSDPLSDHLVGRRIAQRTGVPFLAEFRDLWLGSPYFARAQPTGIHRALQARLERQVVQSSAVVLGLSRGIQQYFERTYPDHPSRVIYNCFDPEEYPPPPPAAQAFVILYAGALYSSRSPETFLAGFSELVRKHRLTPADARFVIAGGSTDLDLQMLARQHKVESYIELLGRLPHRETLGRMQSATALLAIQSPEDNVHVPGKLFEYIGARRPIFLVSPACETADMVTRHQLGYVSKPNAATVAAELDELYASWKARGHAALTSGSANRFSIRETTRELAALLDEVSVAR